MSEQTVSPRQFPLRIEKLGRAAEAVPWIWQGYLARGKITLLTSLWKTGKTTLLSVLLSRRREGGTCAGLPVTRGSAIVVSEEALDQWLRRDQHLQLGDQVSLISRPFHGLPTLEEWKSLLAQLQTMCKQEGHDLVVIDPLALFLPGHSEMGSGLMQQALLPVRDLTDAGVAVLLLHHPRKDDSELGFSARGTGALPGFVDIIMEMKCRAGAASRDRRRRLVALSRFDETPRDLVIELNDAGTDYVARGDLEDDEFGGIWPILQQVLQASAVPLTRKEILADWPNPDQPSDPWLWRTLERAFDHGLIRKVGEGKARKPFRYGLAGK